jgi:hypothetical protein
MRTSERQKWVPAPKWNPHGRGLRSTVSANSSKPLMSIASSSALVTTSGMVPGSSYRDHLTPSPPVQEGNQDEYTPTRQSVHSTTWTTPSQRSNTANISSSTRSALNRLYETIHGPDSCRCLLTQSNESLNVAHAVRHASKSHEVSYLLSYETVLLTIGFS